MPDVKESQLIDYYYNRISKRLFNEKDIYTFLILIRNYTYGKSSIREFADFVAHRDKDRGYIKDYIKNTRETLFKKTGSRTVKIADVFTIKQIEEDFKEVLTKLSKVNFTQEIIKDIILCIIVLLQEVKLIDSKKECIGKLQIGINKNEIVLLGSIPRIVFPVLTIENIYTNQFDSVEENLANLKVIVEVENIMCKLRLKYLTDYKIQIE